LAEGAGLKIVEDEGDPVVLLSCGQDAIDLQEQDSAGEGNALIAVHEAVVHAEAFPEGRSFFNRIRIIAGLWAEERGKDQPLVPNARRPSIKRQLLALHPKHVSER